MKLTGNRNDGPFIFVESTGSTEQDSRRYCIESIVTLLLREREGESKVDRTKKRRKDVMQHLFPVLFHFRHVNLLHRL